MSDNKKRGKKMSQSYNPKEIEKKWYVIDAADRPLGRVASEVAKLLKGKHKPTYSTHLDCGDNVIVINSDKIVLTGNKLKTKNYYNHSQYLGGLRTRSAKTMVQQYPIEMVEKDGVFVVEERKQWNVYQDIADKLISAGVPANEIAFIHEAKNNKQKDAILQRYEPVRYEYFSALL